MVTMGTKKSSQKTLNKSYQSTLYNIQSDDEGESHENELYDSFHTCLDDESNVTGLDDGVLTEDGNSRNDDESVSTTIKDPVSFCRWTFIQTVLVFAFTSCHSFFKLKCVICYDSTIDCVLTPCGHQICCLQCSQNMSKCPICSTKCQSIRIFRP